MNTGQDVDRVPAIAHYETLRRFFLLGYAMNIVLWFVPAVKARVGGFFGFGGKEELLSMFSFARMVSQGSPGLAMFLVLVFASNIVFIVLALKYPKRWIFLAGSSLAAFFLLLDVFSSNSNDQVRYLLLPRLLDWAATALTLTGFLIKPPALGGEA